MLQKIYQHKEKLLVIFVLIGVALFTKLLGFVRSGVLAYFYGTSSFSDTINWIIYPTELILSFVVNNTIITAMTSFFHSKKDEKNDAFWEVIHFYQMILIAICVVIGIILVVSHQEISPVLLIIASASAFFYGISGILQSYLNYKLKFYKSSLQDVVSQVALIVGIVIAAKFGLIAFAAMVLVSGILRVIIQLPEVAKTVKGFKFQRLVLSRIVINRKLLIFTLPLLVSFLISNIPAFIILFLLQKSGAGNVAAYNYATKIITLFNPIVVIPLTTYIIPVLHKMLSDNKQQTVKLFNTLALAVIFISSTAAVFVLDFFAKNITSFVYFRGKFDTNSLAITSNFLKYLAFTIPGYAIMYYLLQLVLLYKRDSFVFISYFIGTIASIITLYFFRTELLQGSAFALVVGTWVSITILSVGLLLPLSKKL